ncbi:MAG: DNA cytosine methyltransferase [Brucella intermedia]
MKHDNDNNALRFLSVCSRIEAASVAWKPLGWQAVAFSEIEKFPSAVLAHHYPDVPNLGDFTKIDATTLGRVDILCGGTPCQAFSIAGARRSLEDERGNPKRTTMNQPRRH